MSYFEDCLDGAFDGNEDCIEMLEDLGEDFGFCRDINNEEDE